MRGGGINAENTQASDGRRVSDRKCRDCDNIVRTSGARLCLACSVRIFERKSGNNRARSRIQSVQRSAQLTPVGELSLGLAGLLNFWITGSAV